MTKKEKELCKQMLNSVYIKLLASNEFDTDTIMMILKVMRILEDSK